MKNRALLLTLLPLAALAAPQPDVLSGGTLAAKQMTFEWQSNLEPWPTSACKHAEDPNENPFDWIVECDGEAGRRKFRAHVALSRYAQTSSGKNSYELLYWVTDLGVSPPQQHSVTQWIHHKNGGDPIVEIDTALGVDDDRSALRLGIRLPASR